MERKKRWSDLTPAQRRAIVAASVVEVALTTAALVDLTRRPGVLVRGPKALWVVGCFVQPVGPIAYLAMGRRRSSAAG